MMHRFSYRAMDSDGVEVNGTLDAASLEAARALLAAKAYQVVELEAHPLPDESHDLQMMARIAQALEPAAGVWSVWLQVLRGARWWLAFAILLALYGLWTSNGLITILGASMFVMPFVLSGLSHRHAARYERFLRAAALGKRDEMQRNADLLSRAIKDPSMRFDLVVRDAEYTARQQQLSVALADVEPYREAMNQRMPGAFEARVALVHLAANDKQGFVNAMRAGWEQSDKDAGRALDAALAEVRCGDLDRARDLLAELPERELPVMTQIFYDWVIGLLAERSGDDGRLALSRAADAFTSYSRLPAVWSAMAACLCDYALALARHGELERGRALVKAVWPVAQNHLDVDSRRHIENTFLTGNFPVATDS